MSEKMSEKIIVDIVTQLLKKATSYYVNLRVDKPKFQLKKQQVSYVYLNLKS